MNFNTLSIKTVVPTVLDNGNQTVLANLANPKKLVCKDNNGFPLVISDKPYVLVNRSILCHCKLTSEFAYLSESLAPCPNQSLPNVVMYFTINLAFHHYYNQFWNESQKAGIILSLTTSEQTLPVYLTNLKIWNILEKPHNLKTTSTPNEIQTRIFFFSAREYWY